MIADVGELFSTWYNIKDEVEKQRFMCLIEETVIQDGCISGIKQILRPLRSRSSYLHIKYLTRNIHIFKKLEDIYIEKCKFFTRLFTAYVNKNSNKLDWSDKNTEKYFIYYDNTYKYISYDSSRTVQIQGVVYSSNIRVLQEAVHSVGEDNFKQYILKV